METYVAQQSPTSNATDFDRILASIAGGIGDYLGRPAPVVTVAALPAAPTGTPGTTIASNDWLLLAIVAAGIYLLLR